MLDQYVTGNFPTAELPQINRTLVVSLQGLDAVMPTVGNRVDLTDYKIGRLHGKLSAPALRKLLGLPLHLLDMVADKSFRSITEEIAMADKEPCESLTGIEQYVQVTERTKHAMENYLSWVQNAMSASPWVNNDLNKKLLSYTTESVTAAVGHVQKLSQAKNLEEVVKIQTEFMSKQLDTFNKQTKTIVEICTKAAQGATKSPTT
jgi:hypothetical protein